MKAQLILLVMFFSVHFSAQAADIIMLTPGSEANIGGTTIQCGGAPEQAAPALATPALPKCYYGRDLTNRCPDAYVILNGKILRKIPTGWGYCDTALDNAIEFYLTSTRSRICDPGGEVKVKEGTFGGIKAVINGSVVVLEE